MINRTFLYFFALVCLLAAPSFARAESIDGTWEGKRYSFTFWSSDVDGYWGDDRYDINFWSSDIDGVVMGERFDINFWSSDIDGYLPCGQFDINIWSSELEGHICGQKFDFDLESGTNGKTLAFRMAIRELLEYLPEPAKGPIGRRIMSEQRKRGWMK